MARITRKQLKSDKFAAEVEHTVEYVAEHRRQMIRYGAIGAAVLVVVLGVYLYTRHQRSIRGEALAEAIRVQETLVGSDAAPGTPVYPNQQVKDEQVNKAWSGIAKKFPGSDEGMIANYMLGTFAAEAGKFDQAEKSFREMAASGNRDYSSLAKRSLAHLCFVTGREAEGEKLMRELIDRPSIFISKEEAMIVLARELMRTKPAEARKLLEPLRTSRTAISQVAISALGEMRQQ